MTGVFIAGLVLQILAYVAETERAFIKRRQAEGIASAKARGVRFGADKLTLGEEFLGYYQKWKMGEIPLKEGAEGLGVSLSTFYRRCMEEGSRENEKM